MSYLSQFIAHEGPLSSRLGLSTWPELIDRMRQGLQPRSLNLRKISLHLVYCTLTLVALIGWSSTSHSETVFRYHLQAEPSSLDPSRVSNIDASYFFPNVMRGLFRYSAEEGLLLDQAKSCKFASLLKIECTLKDGLKWSDGSAITAADYERAFRHLLSPTSKSPAIELLRNLKNSIAVNAGKAPLEKLGVKAVGEKKIVFEFERHDPEFFYKLSASIFGPIKQTKFPESSGDVIVNGPYKIVSWTKGRRLRLERNPHFDSKAERPPVEILFLEDDETALNLYLKGDLTLLRRLPTTLIPKYRTRPDFHQIPIARFDYVGFGGGLEDQPDLRKALAYSLDFTELKKIYDALGIPGCPGLPSTMLDRERCLSIDLKKAKEHWDKVPDEIKKRRLRFVFSRLGGDDIKKGMEWMQGQWKKNLGVTVDLEPTEQGVFLHTLRTKTPDIFRKGVSLDRPTCLGALETFSESGSENFISLKDPKFEKILADLERSTDPKRSRELCGAGVQLLLDEGRLIPQGRIHFTLLVQTKFKGWSLNEMNLLDLANLTTVDSPDRTSTSSAKGSQGR